MKVGTKGKKISNINANKLQVLQNNIKFNVDLSQLEKIGESLEQSATDLLNIQKDYDNTIQNISNFWRDEAGNKFVSSAREFSIGKLSSLHKNIIEEKGNIDTSVNKYKELK